MTIDNIYIYIHTDIRSPVAFPGIWVSAGGGRFKEVLPGSGLAEEDRLRALMLDCS